MYWCHCETCRAEAAELLARAAAATTDEELAFVNNEFRRKTHSRVMLDQLENAILTNPSLSIDLAVRWFDWSPAALMLNPSLPLWFLDDPYWLNRVGYWELLAVLDCEEIPACMWEALKLIEKGRTRCAYVGWRWYAGFSVYRRQAGIWKNRGMPRFRVDDGLHLFDCFCSGAEPFGIPLPGLEGAGLPPDSCALSPRYPGALGVVHV